MSPGSIPSCARRSAWVSVSTVAARSSCSCGFVVVTKAVEVLEDQLLLDLRGKGGPVLWGNSGLGAKAGVDR